MAACLMRRILLVVESLEPDAAGQQNPIYSPFVWSVIEFQPWRAQDVTL